MRGVHNGRYDLAALCAELAQMAWIPQPPQIKDIPHYNRTAKEKKSLEFMWSPDTSTFRKYVEYMDEKKVAHTDRHEAALSFLGADKFRLKGATSG